MEIEDQVALYEKNLKENDGAKQWLVNRGLTEATIDAQRIGYVSDGRYANCISIPYLNPHNRGVRMIRYRFLNPQASHKYETAKGNSIHLYNIENVLQDKVWICEGEFDSLILGQLGFPAVACAGTHGFKTDWKYLFVNCDTVTLVFDGDEPGKQASQRMGSMLGKVVEDLRIVSLPEGMDVTDYYLFNKDSLVELVSN